MKSSLQSRVLALVGAGVFLAVIALSLLSRTSLQSLDREVQHDHERLAASLAREVSRAVGDDLRLLAGAAAADPEQVPAALRDARRFGRLSAGAFVAGVSGTVTACEPAYECEALLRTPIELAARDAIARQRPIVTDLVRDVDGRRRLVGIIPFRSVEGRTVAAAGITIDPSDRRLVELLDAADIAATLRVTLLSGKGEEITFPGSGGPPPWYSVTAPVAGTPWVLQLTDTGSDPSAPIAAFRRRSLWLAPTLAAIAMLLGWGIAGSVRRPLVSLTKSAERIAGGDLSRPIHTRRAADGGDEVARLALALERMRQELQESIGEIESANRELEQRVADRTRELAGANARLEDRERLRQKLLRQVISAQEDERKRIARELHDETSQTLAALGIGVDLAAAEVGDSSPVVRQRLDDARRLVGRMHDELHRLIVNLRPSVLDDLGLAAAIRWFAERQLGSAGIAVRCELGELDVRLPPEIETATFRAVQEALVNIGRHASAESVLIQGSIEKGHLVIEIEDDGVGFDETAVVRSPESLRGIGLLGMRERIEILGGTVRIESAPGSGTRVLFTIPASVAADAAVSVQP